MKLWDPRARQVCRRSPAALVFAAELLQILRSFDDHLSVGGSGKVSAYSCRWFACLRTSKVYVISVALDSLDAAKLKI